jgi:hypothetical protein
MNSGQRPQGRSSLEPTFDRAFSNSDLRRVALLKKIPPLATGPSQGGNACKVNRFTAAFVCRDGHTEREIHGAARHWRGAAHRGDFLRWRFRGQAVVFIGAEVDSLGTEAPRPCSRVPNTHRLSTFPQQRIRIDRRTPYAILTGVVQTAAYSASGAIGTRGPTIRSSMATSGLERPQSRLGGNLVAF